MKQDKALLRIVNKVGSMKKLADILGCHKSNIGKWIRKERILPLKYLKKLIELSEGEVTKEDLRPDVYED